MERADAWSRGEEPGRMAGGWQVHARLDLDSSLDPDPRLCKSSIYLHSISTNIWCHHLRSGLQPRLGICFALLRPKPSPFEEHTLRPSTASGWNLSNATHIMRPSSLGRFDILFVLEHHEELADSRKSPVTSKATKAFCFACLSTEYLWSQS